MIKQCLLIALNRTSLSNPHPASIHIGDTDILFSLQAKNLGVTLANNLSVEKHVTNICRSAYIEIWRISNIRHYLTIDATKPLLCAFVLSKLDYCNSLLSHSPKQLLNKLQKVKNSAARFVFKDRKHEHIKPLLQKLNWLPVVSRIQYKVATLCYNSFTIFPNSWLSTIHPDNFAPFLTPEPSAYRSQKDLWTTNLLFHGPDTVELITVWCSSLSINIFFQASLKNSPLQIFI